MKLLVTKTGKCLSFLSIAGLLFNSLIPMHACFASNSVKSLTQAETSIRSKIEQLTKQGEPDLKVWEAQLELIANLKNQGRDREAEKICRQYLEKFEKISPDSLAVARVQSQLGRILRRQRRLAESEFYQRKTLSICEKRLPPDDSEIALALVDLSKVVGLNREKYDEARALCLRALEIVTKNGDKYNQGYVSGNLATCLIQLNQTDEAIKLYQEYLKDLDMNERSDMYGSTLANIGASYLQVDKYDDAAKYYGQALKLFEDHGMKSSKYAAILRQLAAIDILQERFEQASQKLRQAREIVPSHQENPFTLAAESNRFEFISLLKRLRASALPAAKIEIKKVAIKNDSKAHFISNIDAEISILEILRSVPDADVIPSLEKIRNQRASELGKNNLLTGEVVLQIAVVINQLNGNRINHIVSPVDLAVTEFTNKLLLTDSEHNVNLRPTIDMLGGKKETLNFVTEELIWLANLNGQNKMGDLAKNNLELAEKCIRSQYKEDEGVRASQKVAQKLLIISRVWSALGNLQQSARLAESVLVTSSTLKDDKLKYLALLQLSMLALEASDLEPAKEHATDAKKIAVRLFGATSKEVIPCNRILSQISLANGDYMDAVKLTLDAFGCNGLTTNDEIFLHNMCGFAHLIAGKYEIAKKHLENSLELCNDTISNQAEDRSLFTAASTALAETLVRLGDTKGALQELDWALSSDQGNDAFGGLLATARDCAGLSYVQKIEGDHDSASRYALRAAEYTDKFLKTRITQLSFAQQCSFINVTRQMRSLLLENCNAPKSLPTAYEYIMRWKGLLVETLRSQSAISAAIKSAPESTKNLISELAKTRSKLGELSNGDEATSTEVATLTEKKERLERGLAGLKGSKFFSDVFKDRDATWFRNLLKPDQAFLDILTYRSSSDKLDRYALIVMKAGPGGEPHFVDLGAKTFIDKQISDWRNNITVQLPSTVRDINRDTQRDLQLDSSINAPSMPATEYFALSQYLASLFITNPEVSKLLGKEVKRVWLCPESEMARVPWSSLSTICGASNFTICEVDSPREYAQIALNKSIESNKNNRMLLTGVSKFHDDAFSDLPGTEKEIRGIKEQADLVSFPNEMLVDTEANKTSVCEKLPGASIGHFSTHGFARGDKSVTNENSKIPRVEFGLLSITAAISRNPLVDSGLVLSSSDPTGESIAKLGSNSIATVTRKATTPTDSVAKLAYEPTLRSADDALNSKMRSSSTSNRKQVRNLLTAEEIVGLNLKNCKLISLSACKTGLGTGLDGQGVIGLRSAILAAGARSILMSLWSVDDDATQQLMCKFYGYLLDPSHPISEVEALAKAQEFIRSQPQWKSPIYWAGWVIAGDGWQTLR